VTVLVLDAGNSIIKGKTTAKDGEVSFPHAIRKLTETQYNEILTRAIGEPTTSFFKLGDQAYVVGEEAERFGEVARRSGAARYTADYYSVCLAATLIRLFGEGLTVELFASHPPGDIAYRDDLMRAALGEHQIEQGKKSYQFRVVYANTFDEPVGGLMNVMLNEDGRTYAHSEINEGRSLVIDVGGHTTDWLAVNPGGEVDYSLAQSTPIGIETALREFERSFRANNRDITKDVATLPPDRVREALRTGRFVGGGKTYKCEGEAREATSVMLNRIADTYQNVAGGPLPWDSIILTGGGSAILYDQLIPILKHQRVVLADDSRTIHMANVRGGLKLYRLYEMMNLL
jgi:Actin like proteins N terminal domain/Archaeal actin homologue MreB-like, C-terminal